MNTFEVTISASLLAGTPLALAATGELLGELTGVMNIGLEGMMLVGAVTGFATAIHTGNPDLGLFVGAIAGALFVIVFAVPAVLLNTDQILPGFALWMIALGLTSGFGTPYVSAVLARTIPPTRVPLLHLIPGIGSTLFDSPWPVYLAICLPIGLSYLVRRTRTGLNLRAIGADPAAADAAGIAVTRMRLLCALINGALSGLAGAFISIVVIGRWEDSITAGRGFIALAVVFFVRWRPLGVIFGAYFVGALLALDSLGQAFGWPISSQFLQMCPYLLTIVVLIWFASRQRRSRSAIDTPAALGEPFSRGRS